MKSAAESFGFRDEGIEEIVLDSRKTMHQALFVPIIGERSDGHDYIEMAIQNGAVAVLSSRPVAALQQRYPEVRFYEVENTITALQEIGYMERQRFHGPVIGVTGSVGKTTTRTMVAAALAASRKVFQTAGNANSQVGVPITMFQMAHSGADCAVIELGMSMPGEMTRIAHVACVDYAIMTNIGIAHIEQLKTQENILHEKLHILDGAEGHCELLLNSEDPLLSAVDTAMLEKLGHLVDKDVTIHRYSAKDYSLNLRVKGNHMLQNASAAMHIAELLQADTDGAKKALEAFTGLAGRGETFHTTTGLTIIDDAYNASPVSMKAGLEVLAQLKGSRHIAVLADMLELGERSPEFHREVGRFLAALPIDQIYLYGPLAEEIGSGLCECLPENQSRSIFRFRDFDALRKTLMTNVHEGDVLLFKGSNSMRLSEIVKDFRKDQR